MAAECVYVKYGTGKFLEYHIFLYENQGARNSGWGSINNIINFSSSLGWLDTAYLSQCISNNTYLPVIVDDTYSAMLAGISSTPTFVMDDKKFSGAQPIETFRQIIEKGDLENVEDNEASTG